MKAHEMTLTWTISERISKGDWRKTRKRGYKRLAYSNRYITVKSPQANNDDEREQEEFFSEGCVKLPCTYTIPYASSFQFWLEFNTEHQNKAPQKNPTSSLKLPIIRYFPSYYTFMHPYKFIETRITVSFFPFFFIFPFSFLKND